MASFWTVVKRSIVKFLIQRFRARNINPVSFGKKFILRNETKVIIVDLVGI